MEPFTHLPTEITIDILSRLSVRTTVRCKCVCKSWRSLIETPEFAKLYKSYPSLALSQAWAWASGLPHYKVYEVEDELNNHQVSSKNSRDLLLNFSFRGQYLSPILGSVNGLLFLVEPLHLRSDMLICNPATREHIKLPSPRTPGHVFHTETFGFGVSKTSGQYKLVRIYLHELKLKKRSQVYTLGTGLWRGIDPGRSSIQYEYGVAGEFLNGNLHWLAYDYSKGFPLISCFGLETELFTYLSLPRLEETGDVWDFRSLSALSDCLGLCDNSCKKEIVIWLMKDYGVEKSWTKVYVIARTGPFFDRLEFIRWVKVLEDGDVLIKMELPSQIVCYSSKTKAIQDTDHIELCNDDRTYTGASEVGYTPGFLPLKTLLPKENVSGSFSRPSRIASDGAVPSRDCKVV